MISKNTKNNKKGFALLFSVIIASIIFAITIGISDVAYKENLLTTSGKDSTIAFMASDLGIECALILDKGFDSFAPAFDSEDTFNAVGQCSSIILSSKSFKDSVFNFVVYNPSSVTKACAIVSVVKTPDSTDPTVINTKITSHGYNNSDSPELCNSGRNRTERVLEVTL
jgi:hypothetical protein